VRKSNGGTGTLYWYMTPGIVGESDLIGNLTDEYIFFDGERVARRDGATGTSGVFYYFADHLKTASVITDSAGVIKAESDYYPWGGELQFVNNDSNHYKFTGKERDTETGLDYFGARYYSNGLGRWVSADWSATPVPVPYANFGDPQSLNLYGYVKNIPTTNADLDGHDGPVMEVLADPTAHDLTLIAIAGASTLGPASAIAAPSLGAMVIPVIAPKFAPDDNCAGPACDVFFYSGPPAQSQNPSQGQTQTEEPPAQPDPAPAAGDAGKGSKGGSTAGKRFTPSDRAKDAGKSCVYCGQKTTEKAGKPNSRETDHVHPRSRNGNRTHKNRAPACRTCNRSKSDRTPAEWQRAKKQK
jgi:RHS repeat-associated protein